MKITIKVEEHQGKRGRWKAIKVSENTGELIKSFETRRLRTCSWRRKGDNSRAREKRRKTNLSVQADSQGHVSHYQVLMSRVLPVGR